VSDEFRRLHANLRIADPRTGPSASTYLFANQKRTLDPFAPSAAGRSVGLQLRRLSRLPASTATAIPSTSRRPGEGNLLKIMQRARACALAILLIAASGVFDENALRAETVAVPDNARPGRYGGWECERGYARDGDACTLISIPSHAYLDASGHRWRCERGYRPANDQCTAVVVPANGYMDDDARNGWRCARGYREAGDKCVRISMPENAYSNESTYGKGWSCDRGYRETPDACIKVNAPANGFLTYRGDDWQCDRGFKRSGDQCVLVTIPAGAYLDSAGTGWKCERGMRVKGTSCIALEIPENAHIDHSGHDWACDEGFRKGSAGCSPEEN
jgi:hypothetical protein